MARKDKIEWSADQEKFIRDNFGKMTARQIALTMNVHLGTLRTKYYSMGLKQMEMEYWTPEQVLFLRMNYQQIGDKELSKMYEERWPKNKPWTIKHIEKKRNYLSLHRSKLELQAIQQRNVDNGCFLLCPVKRWEKCGVAQEGEVRYWRSHYGRMVPRIKIGGKFIFWARYIWENMHGPIPKKHNIIFSDGNPKNLDPANLTMVTDAELSQRNSRTSSTGLSDNYVAAIMSIKNPSLREEIKKHPELIELKRNQLKLERTINDGRKQ